MRQYLVVLLLLAGCTTEASRPAMPETVAGYDTGVAAYPVILLAPDRFNPVLCVCKTPAELHRRPEPELSHLQSKAILIDAAGTRFAVRNARLSKPRANEFLRLFSGGTEILEVAFRLYPEGPARNAEVWEASREYHYNFRHCGISPTTPNVELLRAFSNKNCVWPPL